MLLSPRQTGDGVDAGVASISQFQRPTAAADRPAHGFLTLPEVSADVAVRGQVRFHTPEAVTALARAQFDAAPLRARDIKAPSGIADAYAQALFKWFGRQHRPFKYLNLTFSMMDADTGRSEISHQYEAESFTGDAPLYLAVSSDGEGIFELHARAEKFTRAHPQLLATALRLVQAASWQTTWMRTPSELLHHFSHFHWDGDEMASDDDALEHLTECHGGDSETLQDYLPSVVREELRPAVLCLPTKGAGRRPSRRSLGLDVATLEMLTCRRGVGRLCRELIRLRDLVRRGRERHLFDYAYRGNPVYSAAALVWQNDDRIQQLFDDIYTFDWEGGEASMHLGFIPIAQKASAIRRQYADWQLAIQTLASIDRVLGHLTISDPL